MFIIGHRGAAGLELENTEGSIKHALNLHVDAIELDIRLTKDDHLVLAHDDNLSRVSNDRRKIRDMTLEEVQKIELFDGSHTLTIGQALEIIDNQTYIIIDVKDLGCMPLLQKALKDTPKDQVSIASFSLSDVAAMRGLEPDIHLIGLEHTNPFEIMQFVRRHKLDGVGLNFWLINPLTYWLAKYFSLDIYVYTLNKKLLARIVDFLYPKVAICTDDPKWFVDRRSKKLQWPRSWQK